LISLFNWNTIGGKYPEKKKDLLTTKNCILLLGSPSKKGWILQVFKKSCKHGGRMRVKFLMMLLLSAAIVSFSFAQCGSDSEKNLNSLLIIYHNQINAVDVTQVKGLITERELVDGLWKSILNQYEISEEELIEMKEEVPDWQKLFDKTTETSLIVIQDEQWRIYQNQVLQLLTSHLQTTFRDLDKLEKPLDVKTIQKKMQAQLDQIQKKVQDEMGLTSKDVASFFKSNPYNEKLFYTKINQILLSLELKVNKKLLDLGFTSEDMKELETSGSDQNSTSPTE